MRPSRTLGNGDFSMTGRDVLILIPARMAATRLPGKPLADIAGEPMIVHVLRRAEAAEARRRWWWRPIPKAIAAAVEKAGGRAVMTRADHASGSDRIFEALEIVDPERAGADRGQRAGRPADARACRHPAPRVALLDDPAVDIATLAAEIVKERRAHQSERGEGGRLGIVAAAAARALFHPRHRALRRRAALSSHRALCLPARGARALCRLPPSPLEKREKLEQLRALEAGMRIDVAIVGSVPLGVDTPEDLEARAPLLRR